MRTHRKALVPVAFLLAGCLHAQSTTSLPYFTITDLGVLPGTQASTATGISSNGIVSGYSSTVTSGDEGISATGFIYANGTLTPLQSGSNPFTVPIGVNASGQAVGLTGNYASRQLTPFLYQNGQFQIPPNVPNDTSGNTITLLTGINDSGEIVGNIAPQHSGGSSTQPFLWSNGTVTDLPFAFATAVNAGGSVSGWSGIVADDDLNAVIWSSAQTLTLNGYVLVGCSPQATDYDCSNAVQALSLSNAGQAITNIYTGPTYAFGGFLVFPVSGGSAAGGGGIGIGVNSNGWIISMPPTPAPDFDPSFASAGISGDMFSAPVTGMEGALFAWPFSLYFAPGSASGPGLTIEQTTSTGATNFTGAPLNQLIVNGSGWSLSDVAAINDAGQIVGTGYHNGQQRAFLLTPGAPAPTGPSIYAIVGAGLSVPPVTSITAGGWFSVFGLDFLPEGLYGYGEPATGPSLPTNIYQTCVEVNGTNSPLDYVSATQLNVQAPAVTPGSTASVVAISNCGTANEVASAPFGVPVAAQAPEFLYFTQSISGKNPIAAENATGTFLNFPGISSGASFSEQFGAINPGDSITLFAVGLGPTTPPQVPGTIAPQAATVNGPVSVTIGGLPATLSYAGISPGSSGLYQINLTVPAGLASGNQPVAMTVNGTSAPAGGYLTIQ